MLAHKLASLLIVFSEPGFPAVDVVQPQAIDGAVVARSVAELRAALKPGHVLVWQHGSAFPVEAWADISRFLDAGGSMLYLGGEPFTRPVAGEPGHRRVEPRTVAYLKALRLNQCYRVELINPQLRWLRPEGLDADHPRQFGNGVWAAVLEPRLSDSKGSPGEEGAPGSRDADVTPLAHIQQEHDSTEFPSAAAAIAINRYRGRWAGGRWVFWLVSTPPTVRELDRLIDEAAIKPIEFHVDPTFGCYHENEMPSVTVRLHRPGVTDEKTYDISLQVTPPDGKPRVFAGQHLTCGTDATKQFAIPMAAGPGLYRVRATAEGVPTVETGYWGMDRRLFESGDALSFDGFTLRRNGKPEPVVGTTLMSATVHRDFLFEPNAAIWDDEFAELAKCNLNMVRTGVWSAYRKIAVEPGVVNEAWLRSLEAYYLSARKHGIPVIFTFFAFLPEAWGGANPYLDPRAVEAQREYVAAVASRFASAREIMWDLINEPSFSSSKKLWKCRPNGDENEKKAFLKWLESRFTPPDKLAGTWQSIVRERWRLTANEEIGLPSNTDFKKGEVFDDRRPYRAADYIWFAQDAFADWTRQMTQAIREVGSKAAITVGQDEGGLAQRPGPLFHQDAVDFTSMHTWWFNDSLLLDGLGAKARGKPLLISETGIMQRELLSGEALRRPEDSAKLLSRKIGYAFASGAFGVLQWCYDVNPYMASDNEVAIGLRRVDGSYKPEHHVLRSFAEFIARNRARFDGAAEADITVIIPSAEQFSHRDSASKALRRCVEALEVDLGVHVQLIPDYRVATDLGAPKVVILPACRGLSELTWQSIRTRMQAGCSLICSGWFETDDAGNPASRLGLAKRPISLQEICSDGTSLRFPREINESWFAAEGQPRAEWTDKDGLRVWHHALPLEWSESPATLRAFYAAGLEHAGLRLPSNDQSSTPSGLFVSRRSFRDAVLVVMINESSSDQKIRVCPGAPEITIPAGEARLAFVDKDGKRVLDKQ